MFYKNRELSRILIEAKDNIGFIGFAKNLYSKNTNLDFEEFDLLLMQKMKKYGFNNNFMINTIIDFSEKQKLEFLNYRSVKYFIGLIKINGKTINLKLKMSSLIALQTRTQNYNINSNAIFIEENYPQFLITEEKMQEEAYIIMAKAKQIIEDRDEDMCNVLDFLQ